jgi:hypothetical protein
VHLVSRPPRAGGPSRLLAAALAGAFVATVILAGCSSAAAPASFDPTAPCTADVRQAGAYPELETLIPASLDGRPPSRLDSGRNCTAANLGSLTGHGISELHFAGGLWEASPSSGVTLAVFEAAGLEAAQIGEWYEASARLARKTQALEPARPTIDDRQAYRLDLLNGDVPQTVVVWPSTDGRVVQVVIGSGVGEDQILAAIAAFP